MASDDIYIVGVGMTPFGRHFDKSVKQLTAWAVEDALADSECDRAAIGAAFFGNTGQGHFDGQHMIRGQVALLPLGIKGIPIHNVEAACASASAAFNLAVTHLRAGAADVALAVGAEKMYYPDKAKMFGIFQSAWDIETADTNADAYKALGAGLEIPTGTTSDKPYSNFMDVYAGNGRALMLRYGITQRQVAAVASKNHGHSVHNERSQYRMPMTIEEVLAAPPITYPLTLPMCSPISDGAAAAIVCTEEAMKRYGFDRTRAIRVLASAMRTASGRAVDDYENHVSHLLARQVYEQAGIGPEDIDVAELHDAASIGELSGCEHLGLCKPGDSGAMAERGDTTIGGKLPINTSGGLESKGHPIGATGLGQIFEIVQQLRGECGQRQVEGARIGMQVNGGGVWGIEESVDHIGLFGRA
ncbi:thiolase family protein [Sphingomonas cavernae]|uniref:Thiolase family protein n=1 Tax=Sphingomonas cavernae TaxID=2320861 RepID=A0A418WQU2_9SPHN|nr:thiolase family protein [Sphingomonas cavernae]RJF93625.1 thiolase family protein [Sphingomonas cavernae]